jgi:predicted dehydrogenase
MKDRAISQCSRRSFLRTAISAAAAFPAIVSCAALGRAGETPPSGRITIGLIGAGNINTRHCEAFLRESDARIVAVCDPVKSRREAYQKRINHAYGDNACAEYRDFRDMLARQDIDAVCIGTPDHWHAAQSIMAMRAGKDVYVEKPLTLTVEEGQRVVRTASACGRILQTGLQRRSMGIYRRACELVRNGRIGRLTRTEVGIIGVNPGVQVGTVFPAAPVPDGFDYDLWLGPAPEAPFCPQRVARGNETCYWYYVSDYTTGFISGNGVHFVDIAQWGIGDEVKPVEVHTVSAFIPRDGLVDDAVAWQADIRYENGVQMSYSSQDNPHPDGIKFVGTDGWIHINGGGVLTASSVDILRSEIAPGEIHLYPSHGPHRNFLDCIKTRKPTAASPEIGHSATTTCNLVEVSARVGRKVGWNPRTESFINDDSAGRYLSRVNRAPWLA